MLVKEGKYLWVKSFPTDITESPLILMFCCRGIEACHGTFRLE